MPHDLKGNVVEVGQEVAMRFKVTSVVQGTEYCNVSLESVYPLYPGKDKTTLSAVNTKQVEVVQQADWRKVEKEEVNK